MNGLFLFPFFAITPFSTENEISLLYSMQDTNGFIFAGLVRQPELVQGIYNVSTAPIAPTLLELKLFSPEAYNFTAH